MSCGSNRGALSRIALNGQQFRFVRYQDGSNNPAMIDLSQSTIRGIYAPHADDLIDGERVLRSTVFMQPTPAEMTVLLPLLGFTNGGSGTTWTPKTDFASMHFNLHLDYVAGMYDRANTIIAKYVLTGQRGRQPWGLQMELWSKTEAALASWTASAIGAGTLANRPYAFHQGALTLDGDAQQIYRAAIAVDFHVEDEYYNSQTVSDMCPTTWDVSLATAVPFKSGTKELYETPRTGDSRIAGVLTTSATGISTSYTLPDLKALPKAPDILKRNEAIKLGLFYKASYNGTDPIITIVHDYTP